MDFLSGVIASYSTFFSWQSLSGVLTDPASWAIIFSLIVLEGLLSCDNALVLAVVVKDLPGEQKKKALFYGIWGAYLFRFIAIGLGVYLVKFKIIKILGAAYLLWLTIKYFFFSKGEEEAEDEVQVKSGKGFWATVATVEMMDITFSMDSILAAFGVSEKIWVLFIGGMLGILAMRGVANIFLKLLEKYPEYESTAYVLIAIAGAKLMASAFGVHIGELTFFGIMVAVFLGTIGVHYLFGEKKKVESERKA